MYPSTTLFPPPDSIISHAHMQTFLLFLPSILFTSKDVSIVWVLDHNVVSSSCFTCIISQLSCTRSPSFSLSPFSSVMTTTPTPAMGYHPFTFLHALLSLTPLLPCFHCHFPLLVLYISPQNASFFNSNPAFIFDQLLLFHSSRDIKLQP